MPVPPIHTEQDLLKQVAAGDEAAFAELFHLWRDRLYVFILRITGSPERAEDALQDVFIKLWLHRADLLQVEQFHSWLFKVAQNHTIKAVQRRMHETLIMADLRAQMDVAGITPDEALLQKQVYEQLRLTIESLAPQQKKVYTLVREQGVSYAEVAQRLGISESTVKNTMSDALRNIRQKMKDHYTSAPLYISILLFLLHDR